MTLIKTESNVTGKFTVTDKMLIRRFLSLGTETLKYSAGKQILSVAHAAAVTRTVQNDGLWLVNEILDYRRNNRSAKREPLVFALALAARTGNAEVKKAAYSALNEVCKTFTELTSFVQYCEDLTSTGTGWGRAHRRANANWYNSKDARDLAYQITKYPKRNGWSHCDVLRLCHAKPTNEDHQMVFRYAVKGDIKYDRTKLTNVDAVELLTAVEKVKNATKIKEVVRLVEDFNLVREHIPTVFLKEPAVWNALLPGMPNNALVRNLGVMTANGTLASNTAATSLVLSRLHDETGLKRSRMHPFNILVALNTYKQGKGFKGSNTWKVIPSILDALNNAYYTSFNFVPSTDKRFLLGIDVSSSMNWVDINGVPGMTPRVGAAAMAMTTVRTEKNCSIMGFSSVFEPLSISPDQKLAEVIKTITSARMGSTNCALPMLWALKNKVKVDTFIIYTDNEHNTYGWGNYKNMTAADALRKYRKEMEIDAKLIVVGMSSKGFTVADPDDNNMLDVVGFDSAAPQLIANFANGKL